MVTFGSRRQWFPIVTVLPPTASPPSSPALSPITEAEPMVVSSPTLTCSPRIAPGPMAPFFPILAEAGTIAVGSISRLRPGSRSSFAARAKVRRGWAEIRMGLEVAALAKSPAIRAAADERSAMSRCWELSTKTRLPLVADCRLETLVTMREASPRRRQPSCSARSRKVCFMVVYCRFLGGCVQLGDEMRSQIAENPEKSETTGDTGERRVHPQGRARVLNCGLVQWRLPFWAGLPAAVHPEPLIGIFADEGFDDFGEFCGVGHDVGLVIAGTN